MDSRFHGNDNVGGWNYKKDHGNDPSEARLHGASIKESGSDILEYTFNKLVDKNKGDNYKKYNCPGKNVYSVSVGIQGFWRGAI
jgi:hypothetical protein